MPRGEKVKGPDGNVKKNKSYRHAWGDIKKAIGTGHFAQAVTREESIIRDRLISFLCKVNELNRNDPSVKNMPLRILVKRWKKTCPDPIRDAYFADLQTSTDEWIKKRNKVIHEIVASLPGEEHPDVIEFKGEEKSAAVDGVRLVKSIQNWCDRMKYKMRKEIKHKSVS